MEYPRAFLILLATVGFMATASFPLGAGQSPAKQTDALIEDYLREPMPPGFQVSKPTAISAAMEVHFSQVFVDHDADNRVAQAAKPSGPSAGVMADAARP